MKYTIIGDPHLTLKSLDTMGKLVQQVEDLGYPAVWLGDMLDTKSVVQSQCLNFWVDYFAKSKLRHTILVGNHDLHQLHEPEHSLLPLRHVNVGRVIVLDSPQSMWSDEIDGVLCHFIPYINDGAEFRRLVKAAPKNAVLFCHADIKGFDFGTGFISEEGSNVGIFKKFKRVISGHFHLHQQKGNFCYLGTPFSHSFGETDQEKFIGVYDPKTDKLELIPTNLPQHRTLEIDCDSPPENLLEDFLQRNRNAEDIWRVVLAGGSEAVNSFQLPAEVLEVKPKIIKKLADLAKVEYLISETLIPEKQFIQWSERVGNLSEEAQKEGLELLKEVKNAQ